MLVSAFLMFLPLSAVHGITIPPVTLDGYVVALHSFGGGNLANDQTFTADSDQLGFLPAAFGCCGVEALGIPEPFIFTNVSAAPSTTQGSSAKLTVYFEVVGPPNVDVPLIVTGTLEAATDSVSGATGISLAGIELTDCLPSGCSISSGRANIAECLAGASPCDVIVSGTLLHFSVVTNTEYGFYYEDSATSFNQSNTLATGFAEVDPVVSFAPGFADADKFQIFLSNGIGNSASAPGGGTVPEPGTFALAGIALAAVTLLRARANA